MIQPLLLLLLLLSSLLAAAVDVELQSVEVSQPAAPRRLGGLQAERDPALSPDGRILVFSREQEYNHDLWALDLDAPPGTSARRFDATCGARLPTRFQSGWSLDLLCKLSQRCRRRYLAAAPAPQHGWQTARR